MTTEFDTSDLRSVEARLVCELAGAPRLDAEALRRLAQEADWGAALAAAGPRLWPLLAHRIGERGVEAPSAFRERCDGARRDNLLAWMRRKSALRSLLDALAQAGLEATALKGMALAPAVYPAPELRTMSDMDVWIHAPSLDGVREALAPLGWRLPPWRDLGDTDPRLSVGLTLGDPPLVLEVHARPGSLAETVPDLLPEIAARRRRDGGWSVLDPTDQLLHLAAHTAVHHRFNGVAVGLLDITLLIHREGKTLDWKRLGEDGARHDASRMVAVSLAAAGSLFGADIPDAAWSALRVPDAHQLGHEAAELAWWSHVTRENPGAVLAASGVAQLLGAIAHRLRHVVTDRESLDAGAPVRLSRRIWRLARYVVPRHARALLHGAHSGAQGAARRARRLRHAALMKSIGVNDA